MNKDDLLISFKEIQQILSDSYKKKLYLNAERFDKYCIEEFCRLLFYIILEQNNDLGNLQMKNKNLKSDLDSLKKEIEGLSRKVRHLK